MKTNTTQSGRKSGRKPVSERKNYEVASRNPLARVSGSYSRGGVNTRKGNGYDKPLNDMSAPYGAYSLALRAYAKGEPIISDRI